MMMKFNKCAAVFIAAMLAGCAAPASRYYTLQPAQPSPNPAAQVAGLAIRVLPVSVPEQIDRPQIALRTAGSNQLTLLNGSLWAAPISDEIRRMVSSSLAARLGAVEWQKGAVPDSLRLWRIELAVQRFEATYGRDVLLDASWRTERADAKGKPAPRLCAAAIRVAIGEGVPAVVEGHEQALLTLVDLMAHGISGKPLDVPVDRVIMQRCTPG